MHLDTKEEDSEDEPTITEEAYEAILEGHAYEESGEKGGEAAAQIAYADRIVLNKTDLVTEDELKALEVLFQPGLVCVAQFCER